MNKNKKIIAFVGMPGAGKTEARDYLNSKGVPFVRFGDFTEQAIKKEGFPVTTENEKIFREKIRKEKGMGAYGILIKPKIDELIKNNNFIVLDGLYSWEEYIYLRKYFPFLKLISVCAEPEIRYKRLSERPIRPVSTKDVYRRDVTQIENLNTGGPIAIADYFIVNNTGSLADLHKNIDEILKKINIKI